MSGTHNEAEVKTRYPVTAGTTARTTSQTGMVMNLLPTKGSLVRRRDKIGF